MIGGTRIKQRLQNQIRMIKIQKGIPEVNFMATDPVCGATVHEKIASAGYSYQGHIYYFCGQDCKDKFAETLEKYINNSGCVS